jgi:hypothetical protein
MAMCMGSCDKRFFCPLISAHDYQLDETVYAMQLYMAYTGWGKGLSRVLYGNIHVCICRASVCSICACGHDQLMVLQRW